MDSISRSARTRSAPAAPSATLVPTSRQFAAVERIQVDAPATLHLDLQKALTLSGLLDTQWTRSAAMGMAISVAPPRGDLRMILIPPGAGLDSVLDAVRRFMVTEALRGANGNMAEAARQLAVKYTTFYALARRLGVARIQAVD